MFTHATSTQVKVTRGAFRCVPFATNLAKDAIRIHNGNSTLRQSYTQKTAYRWWRMAYFSHSARYAPFHDIPANGTSSLHAPGNKERGPLGAYWVSPETQAPLLYEIMNKGSGQGG